MRNASSSRYRHRQPDARRRALGDRHLAPDGEAGRGYAAPLPRMRRGGGTAVGSGQDDLGSHGAGGRRGRNLTSSAFVTTMDTNYELIAMELGDLLKYDVPKNRINRIGSSVVGGSRDEFPHESITSVRAQTIRDWVLTLARRRLSPEKRDKKLVRFVRQISPERLVGEAVKLLTDHGVNYNIAYKDQLEDFARRDFHREVIKHAKELYLQGNYFHALFEAAKAYNVAVREKARSDRDGQALMMSVWGCDSGVLKITECESETDRNVQDGVKFLSSGLMRAIRNPTAHEPAIDWPISKKDCLDTLSFVSFLFRQLDDAVYYDG